MRFLVDAQLPKALSDFIKSKGIDSIHTLELPNKNKTQDGYITQLATDEQYIVITKDADFLESYVLRKEPPKLLLVKTGNIRNNELISLFDKHIEFIVRLFSTHSLIEVSKTEIAVHS
jgi:predicted nuclease of predicted toxin-antitoxin system